MITSLKSHPFAVEAHFERSIVLTFAVPKKELEPLLPPCLTLDTFEDEWAFLAVAMVQTDYLRPKGFPKIMGRNFLLVGYRIFVRYITNDGKRLRGLYILRSETNRKSMQWLGSLFTRYKYETTADLLLTSTSAGVLVSSATTGFIADIETTSLDITLPNGSPFSNWKDARRFAGPLPFTFSYNAHDRKVLIVEGVRQDWTPQPVHVLNYNFPYLNALNFDGIQLASVFEVKDIPYYWKKGRTELWKG